MVPFCVMKGCLIKLLYNDQALPLGGDVICRVSSFLLLLLQRWMNWKIWNWLSR